MSIQTAALALVALGLCGVSRADAQPLVARPLGTVDFHRALNAAAEPGEWLLNGRTFRAERFSPLQQVNDHTVNKLGLAWYTDLEAPDAIVATPLVVDGTIFISAPFSVVRAIDARTGKVLWKFDPKVRYPRTDVDGVSVTIAARTNRGVAVWGDKVFVSVADCRLIALDVRTGRQVWEQLTCDTAMGYAITGAPQVGKNLVFIGNGMSESGLKTRGYVTAYDASTGRKVWRVYTAPSADPAENDTPALRMAARTWTGDALKKYGGGGNAWDAMTYDPELDLLYFGTAGSLPYTHVERSPQGGDNLFMESVMAVRGSAGEYVWHYQTVPGDNWDYNACNNIILADLTIGSSLRRVLMIAPKNGFFYVLDRVNGKLLSANNFAKVTWASRIDPVTGRPVFNPAANY